MNPEARIAWARVFDLHEYKYSQPLRLLSHIVLWYISWCLSTGCLQVRIETIYLFSPVTLLCRLCFMFADFYLLKFCCVAGYATVSRLCLLLSTEQGLFLLWKMLTQSYRPPPDYLSSSIDQNFIGEHGPVRWIKPSISGVCSLVFSLSLTAAAAREASQDLVFLKSELTVAARRSKKSHSLVDRL